MTKPMSKQAVRAMLRQAVQGLACAYMTSNREAIVHYRETIRGYWPLRNGSVTILNNKVQRYT